MTLVDCMNRSDYRGCLPWCGVLDFAHRSNHYAPFSYGGYARVNVHRTCTVHELFQSVISPNTQNVRINEAQVQGVFKASIYDTSLLEL